MAQPLTGRSVKEGHAHLPEKLREENIPEKRSGMTPEEQTHRNTLRKTSARVA